MRAGGAGRWHDLHFKLTPRGFQIGVSRVRIEIERRDQPAASACRLCRREPADARAKELSNLKEALTKLRASARCLRSPGRIPIRRAARRTLLASRRDFASRLKQGISVRSQAAVDGGRNGGRGAPTALGPVCRSDFRPQNANDFFDANGVIELSSRKGLSALTRFARTMRDYTLKEKVKITAGAVTALVIVAWLVILALALLSG